MSIVSVNGLHGLGSERETPSTGLMIGLDVGSTAVKVVVMDPASDEILWKAYGRHQSKQPEKVLEFLRHIEAAFTSIQGGTRIFVTGSGSRMMAKFLGAKFVQEVNAVSLAVEQLEPDTGSVIELGGQDAKIIIWHTDPETGAKRKVPSMNDKCAGGTGAVIDKINAKLLLGNADLQTLEYFDVKLHPVAGKCGVFAETDIIGLQKQGVPPEQLMASLFEALVQQNLSVLTRGSTLQPKVLLLGGPNTFIPAVRDCWKHNIPKIWEERNTPLPEGVDPKDLIMVPENAEYFAAIGAVLFGKSEDAHVGMYQGTGELEDFINVGRTRLREASGDVGLWRTEEELAEFNRVFAKEPWSPASFSPGQEIKAFIGIDGGSTSTKGVLMDPDGIVLATAYQLSKGNPLADSQDILKGLRGHVEDQGAILSVQGVGTTGYAKDMLKEALAADVAIVETVAHTKSALHYYDDVDVIVDVGGQDIKVIILSNGKVKDFKLNTQCSAGNGYFLQNTAERFGYSVEEYAGVAFSAERLPVFNFGCAVFMETDIVNFQQLGWEKKEIMAGLAQVLPKNIWLYVVAEPNLGKFGANFVLQGGTQHNLAAVKAQYDFIKSRVPGVNIRVHRFTGESGAIGAALEAIRAAGDGGSIFIGLAAAESLEFTTTRDESTRCNYCKNTCLRTFVDTRVPGGDSRRFIIATCEKGAVEKVEDMRVVKARLDEIKKNYPNFVERASEEPFRSLNPPKVSTLRRDSQDAARRPKRMLARLLKRDSQQTADFAEIKKLRQDIKVGIPRALNMYSLAPFFRSYFEALGVGSQNIIFSDHTSPLMWFKGSRRGSIDQCFPSKSVIAHVHNLMFDQRKRNRPNVIFLPILRKLPVDIPNAVDNAPCPSVSITPDVVRAAFTKEGDVFAENGIRYITPGLDMGEPALFRIQMHDCFAPILGVTAKENAEAIDIAFEAWRGSVNSLRREARDLLERQEQEGRVGVVMLGRPYHSDPGLSHEIMAEIQSKGYTVFTIDSLPRDEDILERLFGDEVRAGVIRDPMDIDDVWKNSFSQNTNRKVWAAKYVARHPNLIAIDLSNFKCGHDAPVYSVVEGIIEASGTPFFTFHDIDENKPSGSIKIRVETIDYFLQRYQEQLQQQQSAEDELQRLVAAYKTDLRRAHIGAETNGNGRNGHGAHVPENGATLAPNGAAWAPALVETELLGSNGNGHHTPSIPGFIGRNGGHNGHNGNGKHADAGHDPVTYDLIRAQNTAGDPPAADIPNASAGCAPLGLDLAQQASPLLCQCREEPVPPGRMQRLRPDGEAGQPQAATGPRGQIEPRRPSGQSERRRIMANLLDEREIEDRALEYESRLRKEVGQEAKTIRHFRRPVEHLFTKSQKETTTILWGGLSVAHEHLVTASMRQLGYRIINLPTPDNGALALGKELGSRGQCNPNYYTVGNLLKYLKQLRDRGEQDIEDRYVFVTAGGCGPCRFGMYEAEYRKALRDAGFGRFRVLIFQQSGGLGQSTDDAALQIDTGFAKALLQSFMLGDVINDLGYQIRPYEVNQGETDQVIEEAKIAVGDALKEGRAAWRVLRRLRKRFAAIQVDYTRVKPKVKIIGEFWAQTTEGDGNYKLFRWLESEGAEVAVEPLGTWIEYLIHIAKQNAEEKLLIDKSKKKLVRKIRLLQIAIRWWYNLYRWSLGFKPDPLPNQRKLAEYAHAYYNTHLRGGEGHLEVGKNVMVAKERHAHMVISLKPFGCMPSTMSDGVQSKVVADYKNAIYIPIETSGDGEVNVKSRVQMKLFEAKVRAREEMAEVLAAQKVTIEQVRDYATKHPGYANSMRVLPGHHWTGTAAKFVAAVSRRRTMPFRRLGLARRSSSRTLNS